MGIRFEYGSRKATNGPMIFFSDPVSEINLQEEIRGAIESRLSFYAYRMPGDMMVSFGSSETTIEGIGEPGFTIAPFLPDGQTYTIPYAPGPRNKESEQNPFPPKSTPRQDYEREVEAIKTFIDGSDTKKIVAARVRVELGEVDVAATFLRLIKAYPDAYTFCFSTPQTGCWIGATPELLLQKSGNRFTTMALAGTRSADSLDEWDSKNLLEQRMVTDFIIHNLSESGLQVTAEPTFTKLAGNVEHLCTPIEASDPSANPSIDRLTDILKRIAPTPATAGVPREEALKIITGYENFERGFYGGYCGPFHSLSDFTFFVLLRCGRVERDKFALFAGGGITAHSVAEKEWLETEMKLDTLGRQLEFNNY